MLPRQFHELFTQIMTAELVRLKRQSSLEFSKAHDNLARQEDVSPSSTARLHNQVNVHLVKNIITAIVDSQRELISRLAIPFNDALASDLKDQMKTFVSPKWCAQLYKLNVSSISKQHAARLKEEVHVNRSFFLKRAEAEIDLLADTLRKKKNDSSRTAGKSRTT